MSWFETLTGFAEESPQQVRANLTLDGKTLKSRVNGRTLLWGELETPSLGELRERIRSSKLRVGKTSVREIVANVQSLHADKSNAGSVFQVASQFNLLEMASPNITPERGVGVYERDFTQGPACAIAAGAGTIYRNYFALVNGRHGQTAENQFDCLSDVGAALGNTGNRLWGMTNGYALASREGLIEISDRLRASNENERDQLRQRLRIGIQWDTQVTLTDCSHAVSQVYGSALPVAYSPHPPDLWAEFARLILEASYESTLCAAILNAARGGNNHLFLTLLGGGAFGNETDWILGAMKRALKLSDNAGLDVAIVSYGRSNLRVQQFVRDVL
jgi:hypothetical protein